MQLGVLCRCYPVGSKHPRSKCHWGDRWSKYGKESGRRRRCWGLFYNNLYSILFIRHESRLNGRLEALAPAGLKFHATNRCKGPNNQTELENKVLVCKYLKFQNLKLTGSHYRRLSWWRRNYRTGRGKCRSKWHTGRRRTERKRRRPCTWYLRWISNIRGSRENEEGNTSVLQGWPKMGWNTCQRYWIFGKNRRKPPSL